LRTTVASIASERDGARAEAFEVRQRTEHHAVAHTQRLEQPDAVLEARIEEADGGGVGIMELTVDPDLHASGLRG
jgi:hypothetical protein